MFRKLEIPARSMPDLFAGSNWSISHDARLPPGESAEPNDLAVCLCSHEQVGQRDVQAGHVIYMPAKATSP